MKVYVIIRLDIINGEPGILVEVSDNKERARRYFENVISFTKQSYFISHGENYSCKREYNCCVIQSNDGTETTDIHFCEKKLF